MEEHKTQKQRVLEELLKNGVVTNVWAINSFPAILRLANRIMQLRDDGYKIETEINTERTGKNCHYFLKGVPNAEPQQTKLI